MKPTPLRISLLLGVAFCAACAENPATGGMRFSLVPESQELELGEATASAYLKQNGLYAPDSRISRYVNTLCNRIWAVTPEASKPMQCILLDNETFNAWSTPGYLNVYRGLLPFINSEAELAAIIGHESGHINAHHSGQKRSQQLVGGLLLTGALIAVGSHSDNAESVQLAADVGGIATTAGLMAYSRTFERQADDLGQSYMAKLGYPPLEAAHAMQSMMVKEEYDQALGALTNEGKPQKESMLSGLYADHPATPERQQRLAQTTLQPLPTTADTSIRLDPVGHARYLEALDGTAYGPKPKYGIAGRGILALPLQRVALALPDGFAMDYIHHEDPDKVGIWEGGHVPSLVQLHVLVKPLRLGLSPASLLQNGLSFRGRNVTTFRLNDGTLAATMLRKPLLSGQTTRYFAIASPNPKRDEAVLVLFTYLTDADVQTEDPTIMAIFKNSHLMTIESAKKAQPVKVRIFRAEKGDTVSSRARYLPTGALQTELFRALNSIPSTTEVLTPGVLYKTLSDPVIPE